MTDSKAAPATRSVEAAMEIAAPVDAVWKALTDAAELTRWFPFEARVEPGAGGSIWLGWGDIATWDSRIEVWEPNRHLRTAFTPKSADSSAANVGQAVDYYLEARGGGTYLRLVHSGFGPEATWDEEYDGVRRGWQYELRSLRHYLQVHRGTIRRVAWAAVTLEVPWEEAWQRLMSRNGIRREGEVEGLREGDRYSILIASGQALRGVVQVLNAGMDFAGTVENLNDGLFRVGVESAHQGLTAMLWLATYGLPQSRVDELQAGLAQVLHNLF